MLVVCLNISKLHKNENDNKSIYSRTALYNLMKMLFVSHIQMDEDFKQTILERML